MVTELKKPPKDFMTYVSVARNDYKRFKLKCDESELQNYVIERISDDLPSVFLISVVAAEYDFTPVVQNLEEKIKTDFLTAQNIGPFYQSYKALATEKPIKMPNVNQVANFLHQAPNNSETQLEMLAMRLAAGQVFPNAGGISESVLHDTDEKLAASIAERIEYYNGYGSLLLSYLSWPQPILKAVLENLTMNSYGVSRLRHYRCTGEV